MTTGSDLPDNAAEIAAETFIYGYPLEYGLREIAGCAAGGGSLPIGGPWNELHHARELFGPETTFVSPNNDTLYSLAPFDLRNGPLLFEVPDMGSRYYVFQFIDAWTNNFAYVGTRASGGGAGKFLIAAAGYDGEVPQGATRIDAPTGVGIMLGRIQVDGEQDLEAVYELQARFSLQSLGDGARSSAGVPTGNPDAHEKLKWWETVRVQMAAFPPPPEDESFIQAAASLGLGDSESPFVDPAPELLSALTEGEAKGREMIEQMAEGSGVGPNGWVSALHMFDYNRYGLGFGTVDSDTWKIEDPKKAYGVRALAARAGLFGNHGYEADYELVYADADGEQLDGGKRYELRLPEPPPVDAFWSLTMYDVPKFLLVDNSIDRYSIGDRTPGLNAAPDGSLTIYMQSESPGGEKEANWLPTPEGPFRPIMRLYGPRESVVDGHYELPAIQRVS
jgi:hypothetical protein